MRQIDSTPARARRSTTARGQLATSARYDGRRVLVVLTDGDDTLATRLAGQDDRGGRRRHGLRDRARHGMHPPTLSARRARPAAASTRPTARPPASAPCTRRSTRRCAPRSASSTPRTPTASPLAGRARGLHRRPRRRSTGRPGSRDRSRRRHHLSTSKRSSTGLALGADHRPASCSASVLLMARQPRETVLARRIDRYTARRPHRRGAEREQRSVAAQPAHAARRALVRQLGLLQAACAALLEQADLPMRTGRVRRHPGRRGLLGSCSADLGIGIFYRARARRSAARDPRVLRAPQGQQAPRKFEAQLADTLVAVASSLRAGHSFQQAMSTIAKDGARPGQGVPARRERDAPRPARRRGAAVDGQAARSKNFEFVVLAVNIQRQVGGSLADILDMVADTVREREQFHARSKALTSMGRASAWVLVGMPFFLAGDDLPDEPRLHPAAVGRERGPHHDPRRARLDDDRRPRLPQDRQLQVLRP